jgi:hypothetical protein
MFEHVDWMLLAQQMYSADFLGRGNEPWDTAKRKLENFLEFLDARN